MMALVPGVLVLACIGHYPAACQHASMTTHCFPQPLLQLQAAGAALIFSRGRVPHGGCFSAAAVGPLLHSSPCLPPHPLSLPGNQ